MIEIETGRAVRGEDALRREWLEDDDIRALRAASGRVEEAEVWERLRHAATMRLWRARLEPLIAARLADWHAPLATDDGVFYPHAPRGLDDVGLDAIQFDALSAAARAAATPEAPPPPLLPTDWGEPRALAGEAAAAATIDAWLRSRWPGHLAFLRAWSRARRRCLVAGGGDPGVVAIPDEPGDAARRRARDALHASDPRAEYARDAARPLADLLRETRPAGVDAARALALETIERAAAAAAMRMRGATTAWGLAAAPPAAGETAVVAAWRAGAIAVRRAADADAIYAAMDGAVARVAAARDGAAKGATP